MGLRPAKCYRSLKDRAWSRLAVTVPDRNYIGASPAMRIRQFNLGNPTKEYSRIVKLHIMQAMQIRDNAMESIRIAINRYLNKTLGKDSYFMKIMVYPHNVLRENKQAQGAGADRIQKGMSHPYGKPIGRAIRIKKGQVVICVLCDAEGIEEAKKGLLRAKSRLGAKLHLTVGTDVKSIGTRPRETKEITVEELQAQEKAAKEKAEAKEAKEKGKKVEEKKEAAPAAAAEAPKGEAPKTEEKKAEAQAGTAKKEEKK